MAQEMAPTCPPWEWGSDVVFCSDSIEKPDESQRGGEQAESGGRWEGRPPVRQGLEVGCGRGWLASSSWQIRLALCYLSLLPPPLSPLSPPPLSPPPLLSTPREQAEPASAPHCAHSRCSPPLSLPMKEETTGVCMHPPIKTRLVGTWQGEGPGQERRGGRSRQAAAPRVCRSGRALPGEAGGLALSLQDGRRVRRPAGSGWTEVWGCGPAPHLWVSRTRRSSFP